MEKEISGIKDGTLNKGESMGKVNILPPEVISKIAAGEVVERPASVIKELVENAFDAQTGSVEVSLKHAGKTYIRIKDTGIGIEPDDVEKIFFRHATSKIKDINQLSAILSLGFRGEALYSIAAVADVTLRSKVKSSDTGWEVHIRGGEKLDLKPVSMPEGTEVEVTELFFNTPARRKFLKSDTTELHQILNVLIPYSLLYPERRFLLEHYNETLLDLPPEKNYTARISKALHIKSEYIIETEKEFTDKGISIRLLLGDINIQRARKDMQFVFVNNRPVHNYMIGYHVNQIYKILFPQDLYPFFAVYITMPSEDVDVNIHPTKREVKIKNESVLFSLLRELCEQTLLSYGKAKQIETIPPSLPETPSFLQEFESPVKSGEIREPSHEQYVFSYPDAGQPSFPVEEKAFVQLKDNFKDKLSKAKYIGAFIKKYLFFEYGLSLLIVDQHAAHERITYEKLLKQMEKGQVEVQRLLTPIVIQVSLQEILIWEQLKDKLETLGLSTTLWDNEHIAIHAHPNLLRNPEIAMRNLLSEEDSTYVDNDTLLRRSCRSSVMAGDKINDEEALYLRNELIKCKDPFTCIHGRPTVIEIKDVTFEKQFLRG